MYLHFYLFFINIIYSCDSKAGLSAAIIAFTYKCDFFVTFFNKSKSNL